jgi:hypothetical protein
LKKKRRLFNKIPSKRRGKKKVRMKKMARKKERTRWKRASKNPIQVQLSQEVMSLEVRHHNIPSKGKMKNKLLNNASELSKEEKLRQGKGSLKACS